MDKPKWWPENPYPKSVFPMERDEYQKIVPDHQRRTALSGMLGREFWDIASNDIWEVVETQLDKHKIALEEIIIECGDVDQSHWPGPQQMAQSIAQKALEG